MLGAFHYNKCINLKYPLLIIILTMSQRIGFFENVHILQISLICRKLKLCTRTLGHAIYKTLTNMTYKETEITAYSKSLDSMSITE